MLGLPVSRACDEGPRLLLYDGPHQGEDALPVQSGVPVAQSLPPGHELSEILDVHVLCEVYPQVLIVLLVFMTFLPGIVQNLMGLDPLHNVALLVLGQDEGVTLLSCPLGRLDRVLPLLLLALALDVRHGAWGMGHG